MLIIGLNAFHPDSAACALVDGKLVAAVAGFQCLRREGNCSCESPNSLLS